MGDHRQYSKVEEALEIKSLRRIISAYLNYQDAAEADVRRYERSYRKLPPVHKELLSHLPVKYEKLRRCISMNTFFILNMLQEFEPPLDMSQDIDGDDQEIPRNCCEAHLGKSPHQHTLTDSDHTSNFHESNTSRPESSVLHGENTLTEKLPSEVDDKQEMHLGHCWDSEDLKNTVTEKLLNEVNDKQEMHLGHCCDSEDLAGLCNGHEGDAKTVADSFSCCTEANCEGKSTEKHHGWMESSLQLNVPLVDVDKVRCIIRNIVRDWAAEGQKERDQCYKPILQELDRKFPNRSKERPPCCLVPGAGLGRLALEISCHGFECQGNEFSYYMMICSSFILNHTQVAGEWTIYPWIHSNCNSLSDDDQLRPISFPDIHPASAGITEGFSMCGGDFVEVYNDECQEAHWDAVVTCFFLDTAHNIVEYIETISKILKPGGVWINLGPLLYHFADSYGSDEMSIELSLEEVKKVALSYGFELEMETTIETTYTTNPRSMMQNRYFAAFWTMKKIR